MVLAVGNRRGLTLGRDATGAASASSRWRSPSRVHPGRTALTRCSMAGFALSCRAPSKVDSAQQVLRMSFRSVRPPWSWAAVVMLGVFGISLIFHSGNRGLAAPPPSVVRVFLVCWQR